MSLVEGYLHANSKHVLFSAYSRRSVTLRGVVEYQPGNAPRVLALELTSLFR